MPDNLIFFTPKVVEPVSGNKVQAATVKDRGFGAALAGALARQESPAASSQDKPVPGLGKLLSVKEQRPMALTGDQVSGGTQLGSLAVDLESVQGQAESAGNILEVRNESMEITTGLQESLGELAEILALLQQAVAGLVPQNPDGFEGLSTQPVEGDTVIKLSHLAELVSKLVKQGEETVQLLSQMPNLSSQQEQMLEQLTNLFGSKQPGQELEAAGTGSFQQLLAELETAIVTLPDNQSKEVKPWPLVAVEVEGLLKQLVKLVEGKEEAVRGNLYNQAAASKTVTETPASPADFSQNDETPRHLMVKNPPHPVTQPEEQKAFEGESGDKAGEQAGQGIAVTTERPLEQLQPEILTPSHKGEANTLQTRVSIPVMAREIHQQREQVFQQIIQKAHLLVAGEHAELNIQLKPDHLGKLTMQVVVENGLVTAKFAAESMQVKELIEANLGNLRQTLTNQGLKVDQITVSVNQGGDQMLQWSKRQNNQPGKPGKNMLNRTETDYLEPLETQEYGRGLGIGDSMVDYRI